MSIKHLIQIESDTVTEKPISIPFDFADITSVPKGKVMGECIVIRPITVYTWFRLKPLLMSIDKEDFDQLIEKKELLLPDSELNELIGKYDELLLEIICIGIHNKRTDAPQWFKEVLKDNCTWRDVYILLNAVLFRIGYAPFCKSITTLKSVSPLTEAEIIAAQKNMKSWTSL